MPAAQWAHPLTVHIVTTITVVWGAIFVAMALNAFPRERRRLPPAMRAALPVILVVAGIAFTSWYPGFAVAHP